jgi:hypothetical protein
LIRFPSLADGERDLGLPVYLRHAERDLDVIIGATARQLGAFRKR